MKAKRQYQTKILRSGEAVCFVPLGNDGFQGECVLDKADMDNLVKLGVTTNWFLFSNGKGVEYVYAKGAKNNRNLSIARMIMDCRPGEQIRFIDGNPLNLRRENLSVIVGGSIKTDSLYV